MIEQTVTYNASVHHLILLTLETEYKTNTHVVSTTQSSPVQSAIPCTTGLVSTCSRRSKTCLLRFNVHVHAAYNHTNTILTAVYNTCEYEIICVLKLEFPGLRAQLSLELPCTWPQQTSWLIAVLLAPATVVWTALSLASDSADACIAPLSLCPVS